MNPSDILKSKNHKLVGSPAGNAEMEIIIRNILVMLVSAGDVFREFTRDEYVSFRKKTHLAGSGSCCGRKEMQYFDKLVDMDILHRKGSGLCFGNRIMNFFKKIVGHDS